MKLILYLLFRTCCSVLIFFLLLMLVGAESIDKFDIRLKLYEVVIVALIITLNVLRLNNPFQTIKQEPNDE